MLELDNLLIQQGAFSLAANLTIPAGQTTAILGPSGAGKSTLLLALAGFTACQGRIIWRGDDISSLSPSARPVSMLFQENNLFPHLSVAQNVGLGIRPDLKLTEADRQAVRHALDKVGLTKREADLPRSLSGGQRQRVALARGLLRKKPLWLLDEPFAALGPALRHEMLALVEEIRAGQDATVLLVTHAPEEARRIANTCIFVDNGQVAPPVDTASFFKTPSQGFTAYLGQ